MGLILFYGLNIKLENKKKKGNLISRCNLGQIAGKQDPDNHADCV
jgi:hypothetical protein